MSYKMAGCWACLILVFIDKDGRIFDNQIRALLILAWVVRLAFAGRILSGPFAICPPPRAPFRIALPRSSARNRLSFRRPFLNSTAPAQPRCEGCPGWMRERGFRRCSRSSRVSTIIFSGAWRTQERFYEGFGDAAAFRSQIVSR